MTTSRVVHVALRRLVHVVPVVAGIVTVTFALIHLAPGDPIYMLAGEGGDVEYYAAMRARYGLDQPLPGQYLRYVRLVLQGDFGHSYGYQQPVFDVILARLPATILLSATALAMAVIAGLGLGVVAGIAPGSWADVGGRVASSILVAAPVFWTGQLLLLAFAVAVPLFPVGGLTSLRGEAAGPVADVVWHLVLPALCLSVGFLAVLGRVVRSSVLAEVRREYVRAARARGHSRVRAILGHALPNALLPAIPLVGHQAGSLLTGAALVEVVFGWPGIGRLLLDASAQRDYPLVVAVLLAVSFVVVAANAAADAAYVIADPRIE